MTAPSSEKLAKALDKARLPELAARARADEFHDFRSPHAAPAMTLAAELARIGTRDALTVRGRVIMGDYDADGSEDL